jgi:hypothetical protein
MMRYGKLWDYAAVDWHLHLYILFCRFTGSISASESNRYRYHHLSISYSPKNDCRCHQSQRIRTALHRLVQIIDAAAVYPHITYRSLHMHIAALMKLRKYDDAHSIVQLSVCATCSPSTRCTSRTPLTAAAAPADAAEQRTRIGSIISFELHVLLTQPAHFMGTTRHAIDEAMALLHRRRLQLQRTLNGAE